MYVLILEFRFLEILGKLGVVVGFSIYEGGSRNDEMILLFSILGAGLLDFKFNTSPRLELFSSPDLLLAHPYLGSTQPRNESPGEPNIEFPRRLQPRSVPGVTNLGISLECPTQSLFGMSNSQNLPGVYNRRVSPDPEYPWSVQPQNISREGGDTRRMI